MGRSGHDPADLNISFHDLCPRRTRMQRGILRKSDDRALSTLSRYIGAAGRGELDEA